MSDYAGRVYRSGGQFLFNVTLGVTGTLVMVIIGAASQTVGARVISYGFAAVLAAMTGRVIRAGVRVNRDGVLIRGVLRTYRVPWSEIEGFAFRAAEDLSGCGHYQAP